MSKAICLWLNSTPGRLLLLNRRAKKLTYPQWSTAHWKEIPIPKGGLPRTRQLTEVFEAIANRELKPLQFAATDKTRILIDEVAALALDVSPDVMADWRSRLAAEPTITNARPAKQDR